MNERHRPTGECVATDAGAVTTTISSPDTNTDARSGRIVALIGADGTGKSTVSAALGRRDDVVTMYMGSNPTAATHVLPTTRLVWAVKRSLGRELHHSGPPDAAQARRRPSSTATRWVHHAKSIAVVTLRSADETYRFAIATRHRRRGDTVVVDRHPRPDSYGRDVLGTRGWLRAGDRLHRWLVWDVYPRPDLIILLDAPTETLWARKQEGSLESLDARRAEYRSFADADDRVVIVDATQPVDVVAAEVEHAIAGPGPTKSGAGASARLGASDVVRIASTLDANGVTVCVDRGFGIDALVGEITRPHGDLDLLVAPGQLGRAAEALAQIGFTGPIGRIGLDTVDADGRRVDVREDAAVTAEGFVVMGSLDGEPVPCMSAEHQIDRRMRHRIRQTDVHALTTLRDRLGTQMPHDLPPLAWLRAKVFVRRVARRVLRRR